MLFKVYIKNYLGKEIEVEVSYEIYKLFEEERKAENSYNRSQSRHPVVEEADSDLAGFHASLHNISEQDKVINRIELYKALQIIKSCTETQQRRFYLNRILGYSVREIARQEHCNKSAVQKSVDAVKKKLNIFFSKQGVHLP